MLTTIIATILLLGILFLAIKYIVSAKRKGVKCIGCSSACSCSGKCCGGIDKDEILEHIR